MTCSIVIPARHHTFSVKPKCFKESFEAGSFLLTWWTTCQKVQKFMHHIYLRPLRNAIVDQELVKWLDNPVWFCDLTLHSAYTCKQIIRSNVNKGNKKNTGIHCRLCDRPTHRVSASGVHLTALAAGACESLCRTESAEASSERKRERDRLLHNTRGFLPESGLAIW